MTWSLVVHDPATNAFAVAVTTCNLAVGASCPHVRTGVGAVSTQSFTNRYLAPSVLDGIARGLHPADAIQGALVGDGGRELRQIHAVDRYGRSAAFTGANCVEWSGEHAVQGFSVAGNMLSGPAVVNDTVAAFAAHSGEALPERMLLALEAGEAAGGDRRGRQSAAIKMITAEDFPDLDLRVDDHPEPLKELRRLLNLWRRDRAPFLDRQPRRGNPSGTTDMDAIEDAWKKAGLDLRFRR